MRGLRIGRQLELQRGVVERAPGPRVGRTPHWWLLATAVAVIAFGARLVPVLSGGGLYGLGHYDDAVYYSAAVGFVHGRLPYRDFLLLHPPGVVLALAPIAGLGRVLGDPTGFAVARLAWMALGGLNAILVTRILRPAGMFAAVFGGLFYALFQPAIYGEHTTQLEGIATTCMLLALCWLSPAMPRTWPWAAAAGAALGAGACIKIWGVVPIVLAAGWLLVTAGRKRAGHLLLGALAAGTAICLPFFAAAPAAMFRMVVGDQLGRPVVAAELPTRLAQILGLWPGHLHVVTPALLVGVAAFAVVGVFAWTRVDARLAVTLLAGLTAMLILTPSWFLHYSALIAGPAAVTVGFAAAQLRRHLPAKHPALVAVAVMTLLAAAMAPPVTALQLGRTFQGGRLAAALARTRGCVTTDEPTTLIETDTLSRNLHRGCPLVVDLGGYSYDDQLGRAARLHDQRWQRYALAYLGSGSYTIITRFSSGRGFSPATAHVVKRWPLILRLPHAKLRRIPSTAPSPS